MDFNQLFSQIRSLVTNSVGVEMAFGKPTKVNDLHIIPVAKVVLGFGGGGGISPNKRKKSSSKDAPVVPDLPEEPFQDASEQKPEANIGGGGGGGLRTYPIGIYTIKGEAVKFYPVISIKEIIALITLGSVLLVRFSKLMRKGK